MLLLQIATRFSKWGKHVAKKMVVPSKGCRSSERELLYIHAPSIWCTLQCIISCIRREIFFLSPILSLLWFFRKVFVQNLVVPWNFFWKSIWTQIFIKFITQSMTLISFNFNMGHWLRGRVISKFYESSKLATLYIPSSFSNCDGYVVMH